MPYGSVKIDNIIFTRNGVDYSVTVSGLAEATTGSITLTGNISGQVANFIDVNSTSTISGNVINTASITGISGTFTTRISGTTITGNTAQFTNVTGVSGVFTSGISGNTGIFTVSLSGTKITGATGVFTTLISGATITGNQGQFTTLTGETAGFTTITGTTVTGTTANFQSGVFAKGLGVGQSNANTFTGVNAFFDINGVYVQTVSAVGALNIDCSSGNYYTKTINGNSTFTVSNVPASGRSYAFTIELTVTSGNITWFSNVQWPGGTAPTLITGKTHLISFITDDGGSRWRGSSLTNYTT